MVECEHDYEHPIRKGRAYLVCPKCGEDITFMIYTQKTASFILADECVIPFYFSDSQYIS